MFGLPTYFVSFKSLSFSFDIFFSDSGSELDAAKASVPVSSTKVSLYLDNL